MKKLLFCHALFCRPEKQGSYVPALAQQGDDAVQDNHGEEDDADEGTICVFHV